MECRLGCGACCIAPSINSPIPGMPSGKLAGERCVQLDSNNLCLLFGKPGRPKFCADFNAAEDTCGENYVQALQIINSLESDTKT